MILKKIRDRRNHAGKNDGRLTRPEHDCCTLTMPDQSLPRESISGERACGAGGREGRVGKGFSWKIRTQEKKKPPRKRRGIKKASNPR